MNSFNSDNGNGYSPFPVTESTEKPNKARELNDYLFSSEPSEQKPLSPEKEKRSLDILKRVGILFLTLAVAFAGAFYSVYFVCKTSLVGDSEFFAAFMAKWAGVTENRVEVDYITGEYKGDNIDLSDKILNNTLIVRTVSRNEEKDTVTVLSHGSGVIYSHNESSGITLALTNYHVIENGGEVLVETYTGDKYYGKVKASDRLTDLAIIEFLSDRPLAQAAHSDSDNVKVGQNVAVAGNPLGNGFSVSFGYVSAKNVNTGELIDNQIQLDISVNPGNSGGGVYDSQGNLIGIVVSKASGENIDGIGYALPINEVNEVVNDLLVYGYVQGRPALGISVINILTEAQYDYYKNNDLSGHLFEEKSGSKKFGVYIVKSDNPVLHVGDRIIAVNGVTVIANESVSNAIAKLTPGSVVKILVERAELKDGAVVYTESTLSVVLGTRNWAD